MSWKALKKLTHSFGKTDLVLWVFFDILMSGVTVLKINMYALFSFINYYLILMH